MTSASSEPAASASAPPPAPLGPPGAIDMHVDTPWQVRFKGHSIGLEEGQVSIGALQAGRYRGLVYPIYIADHLNQGHPTIRDAEKILGTIGAIIKRHDKVLWPDTAGPTPEGMITVYVSIEGAGAFAENPAKIDDFIKRGVIFVGPVHWHDDAFSTAATGDDSKKRGLSKLGKDFCHRVYKAGGIVDISHMSDLGVDDLVSIAEVYGAPIVATHSNARAVLNHVRNLTDDQLRLIKKTGGVAGLNFERNYIAGKESTLEQLVDHAMHMIEVAGIDHVGIGSDYDGGTPPAELVDAGRIQSLAEALKRRGLSDADVHKIFSGNTLRVIDWAKARQRPKGERGAAEAEPDVGTNPPRPGARP